jgi:uncharacterized membrane protein
MRQDDDAALASGTTSDGWFTRLRRSLLARLGNTGLVLGTLFFAASLTPSLTPRITVAQAVLSGMCLAAGYGLGVLLRWLWGYLELPLPGPAGQPRRRRIAVVACAVIAALALWRSQHWENIVRELMHLAPAGPSRILGVLAGAAVVALLLVVLGRIALMIIKAVMRLVTRKVPRRIAHVVGAIAGVLLLVGLVNGVILSSLLDTLDASYRQADALIPPDMPPPTEWDSPGSAQSLVAWNQLGRMGRRYVDARPTADELAAYAGPGAKAPLRVYAGLPTGDTPEERAQLALEELKRVGGFERKALIIITPTGTGWVDPSGIDGIEYLYRGDVASVAVQYSYLSSPLTLFLDPDTGGGHRARTVPRGLRLLAHAAARAAAEAVPARPEPGRAQFGTLVRDVRAARRTIRWRGLERTSVRRQQVGPG